MESLDRGSCHYRKTREGPNPPRSACGPKEPQKALEQDSQDRHKLHLRPAFLFCASSPTNRETDAWFLGFYSRVNTLYFPAGALRELGTSSAKNSVSCHAYRELGTLALTKAENVAGRGSGTRELLWLWGCSKRPWGGQISRSIPGSGVAPSPRRTSCPLLGLPS